MAAIAIQMRYGSHNFKIQNTQIFERWMLVQFVNPSKFENAMELICLPYFTLKWFWANLNDGCLCIHFAATVLYIVVFRQHHNIPLTHVLNCIQQHHLQSHSNELTNGLNSPKVSWCGLCMDVFVCTQCASVLRYLYLDSSVFILYILLQKFSMTTGEHNSYTCVHVSFVFRFRCICFEFHFGKIFQNVSINKRILWCGCTQKYTIRSQLSQCSVTIFQNVASIFLRIGGIENVYIARMNK